MHLGRSHNFDFSPKSWLLFPPLVLLQHLHHEPRSPQGKLHARGRPVEHRYVRQFPSFVAFVDPGRGECMHRLWFFLTFLHRPL